VTDLNRLVSEVARTLRPVMGADVRVLTRLAPEVGHVRIDRTQFEQVLMNLAVNARDAMPDGGTLELSTGRREVQAGGAVPAGSYAVLSVEDSGVGMDAETRSRVFEPFFSTKSSGEGTGLGLAMVYGIVQQSGGHVTLKSEPGRGSVFWIHLPTVDGVRAEGTATARTA
jgi:signal transduction histidine kinase